MKEEMIVGEIYYCWDGNEHSPKYGMIFNYTKEKEIGVCQNQYNCYIDNYISITEDEFKIPKSNYICYKDINSYDSRECRLATPFEKQWFYECNKQDKFIPKDQIKFDIIPKYWVIKGSYIFGEYCKTINSNIYGNYEYYYKFISRNENGREVWSFTENIPLGYTEITFEQFKKHILKEKEEVMENKNDNILIKLDRSIIDKGYADMNSDQKILFGSGVNGFTGVTTQGFIKKFYNEGNICAAWKEEILKLYPFVEDKFPIPDFNIEGLLKRSLYNESKIYLNIDLNWKIEGAYLIPTRK